MNSPILARDIMVTKLVVLRPGMDVHDAVGVLLKHRISGAPVVDEQRNFVGVFSERCSMEVLLTAVYDGLPTNAIDPFVDTQCRTIDEETDLLTMAQLFNETRVRRLPVLRESKLVGQISRRDLLRAAHDLLRVPKPSESGLLYLSALVERQENPIG